MRVYIYCADLYCETCGQEICDNLPKPPGFGGQEAGDQMWDSDDYPKLYDGETCHDSPVHCANGSECRECITVPIDGVVDGVYASNEYGKLLTEVLTDEGEDYVANAAVRSLVYGDGDPLVIGVWLNAFDVGPAFAEALTDSAKDIYRHLQEAAL